MLFTRLVVTLNSKQYINVKYQGRIRNTVAAENNAEWSFDVYHESDGSISFVSPLSEHVGAIKVIKSLEFEIWPLNSNKWCRYKFTTPIRFVDEPLTHSEFNEIMKNYHDFMLQKASARFEPAVKKNKVHLTQAGVRQSRFNRMHASIPSIVKDFNKKQRHIRIATNILGFDATAYVKKLLERAEGKKEKEEEENKEIEELIQSYEDLDWDELQPNPSSVGAQFDKMSLNK